MPQVLLHSKIHGNIYARIFSHPDCKLSVPESHRFSAHALADFKPPVGNLTLPRRHLFRFIILYHTLVNFFLIKSKEYLFFALSGIINSAHNLILK